MGMADKQFNGFIRFILDDIKVNNSAKSALKIQLFRALLCTKWSCRISGKAF